MNHSIYGITLMDYEKVKRMCHVRSAIYRQSVPEILYWKNHEVPLDDRVPDADKAATDWLEFDPREEPSCSAYNEMPA